MVCELAGKDITVRANGRLILEKVSFTLNTGLSAIIGPNGAGKSTLLKVIAGLTPYEGELTYCGSRIGSLKGRASYMPATPVIDPLATVSDVLEAGLYGTGRNINKAIEILEVFLPREYSGRRFSTLSSGEQRLVCLARALSRGSRVILLDEPLSFLDVRNQVKILNFIRKYALEHQAVIVAALHEIHFLYIFNKIILLHKGRVRFYGTIATLRKEDIEETYGVEVLEVSGNGFKGFIPIAR